MDIFIMSVTPPFFPKENHLDAKCILTFLHLPHKREDLQAYKNLKDIKSSFLNFKGQGSSSVLGPISRKSRNFSGVFRVT